MELAQQNFANVSADTLVNKDPTMAGLITSPLGAQEMASSTSSNVPETPVDTTKLPSGTSYVPRALETSPNLHPTSSTLPDGPPPIGPPPGYSLASEIAAVGPRTDDSPAQPSSDIPVDTNRIRNIALGPDLTLETVQACVTLFLCTETVSDEDRNAVMMRLKLHARSSEGRNLILQTGCIPKIVFLMIDPATVELAAALVVNLAYTHHESKSISAELIKAGAIQRLTWVLEFGSDAAKASSVNALANLVIGNSTRKDMLVDADGFLHQLSRCLRCPAASYGRNATRLFHTLAAEGKTISPYRVSMLAKSGCAGAIAVGLNPDDAEYIKFVMPILYHIFHDDATLFCSKFVQEGGDKKIEALISTYTNIFGIAKTGLNAIVLTLRRVSQRIKLIKEVIAQKEQEARAQKEMNEEDAVDQEHSVPDDSQETGTAQEVSDAGSDSIVVPSASDSTIDDQTTEETTMEESAGLSATSSETTLTSNPTTDTYQDSASIPTAEIVADIKNVTEDSTNTIISAEHLDFLTGNSDGHSEVEKSKSELPLVTSPDESHDDRSFKYEPVHNTDYIPVSGCEDPASYVTYILSSCTKVPSYQTIKRLVVQHFSHAQFGEFRATIQQLLEDFHEAIAIQSLAVSTDSVGHDEASDTSSAQDETLIVRTDETTDIDVESNIPLNTNSRENAELAINEDGATNTLDSKNVFTASSEAAASEIAECTESDINNIDSDCASVSQEVAQSDTTANNMAETSTESDINNIDSDCASVSQEVTQSDATTNNMAETSGPEDPPSSNKSQKRRRSLFGSILRKSKKENKSETNSKEQATADRSTYDGDANTGDTVESEPTSSKSPEATDAKPAAEATAGANAVVEAKIAADAKAVAEDKAAADVKAAAEAKAAADAKAAAEAKAAADAKAAAEAKVAAEAKAAADAKAAEEARIQREKDDVEAAKKEEHRQQQLEISMQLQQEKRHKDILAAAKAKKARAAASRPVAGTPRKQVLTLAERKAAFKEWEDKKKASARSSNTKIATTAARKPRKSTLL